jgi:hypothetical protein
MTMTMTVKKGGIEAAVAAKERRERWNFYLSVVRPVLAIASLFPAIAWTFLGGPAPPL